MGFIIETWPDLIDHAQKILGEFTQHNIKFMSRFQKHSAILSLAAEQHNGDAT